MAAAVFAESRYHPRADTVEALDARLSELVRSGAPLRRALARMDAATALGSLGKVLLPERPTGTNLQDAVVIRLRAESS